MRRWPLVWRVWLLVMLGSLPDAASRQPAEGWESIFDGQGLAGWTRTENSSGRVSVADGSIVFEGDTGWLLHTGGPLRTFALECEFRVERPESSLAFLVRSWPALDGVGLSSRTGNAFRLNSGTPFSAEFLSMGAAWTAAPVTTPAFGAADLRVGPWHRFRCDCQDDVCTFSVNGNRVAIAADGIRPIGHVGFALTGGRAAVRNVRVSPPGTTPWESMPVCGQNGLSLPSLVKEVKPGYAREAYRRKIAGTVRLDIVITTEGRTGGIRVERSLDRKYGLDRAAVEAVSQWRFDPARLNGRPVACVAVSDVSFTLSK